MRRVIKIENKTDYQTRHVRAFVVRVANAVLNDKRKLHVVVYHKKGDQRTYGSAYANSGRLNLALPRDSGEVDKVQVCTTLAWLLGVCRGLKAADMNGAATYTLQPKSRELYAWAESLPLEKKPAPGKPNSVVLALQRAEHAQEKVHEWEIRVKHAETMLRKWRKRLRYHDTRSRNMQLAWAKELEDSRK